MRTSSRCGWISAGSLYCLVQHPLTRLYLLALIPLSLFHGAHRTVTTLEEIGLKGMHAVLAFLFYGGAILGSILTIVLLVRL